LQTYPPTSLHLPAIGPVQITFGGDSIRDGGALTRRDRHLFTRHYGQGHQMIAAGSRNVTLRAAEGPESVGGHQDRNQGHGLPLYSGPILGYDAAMENRSANIAIVGGGAVFGVILAAAATGALTPVWSFFMEGLIQHFISMQWTRFGCF